MSSKRKPVRGKIAAATLRARARKIRLVLTDNDGVLTDTGVYYGSEGEVMKRYSIRDGMGVERLRDAGIETAIVTGELSGNVKKRAEKLQMRYLYLGVRDKEALLPEITRETGCTVEQIAYIGDDVNDLGIMAAIAERGITAAPADAVADVARSVHYRCAARGGFGAFREFADWILSCR
jgi:3-deoxy-D-manno-octulosonate 8-phosphate phosphatase (KDO 8-P phosphatase)